MGKQCRFLDEEDCYLTFAYTEGPDGQLKIFTQKNKGLLANFKDKKNSTGGLAASACLSDWNDNSLSEVWEIIAHECKGYSFSCE